MWAEQLRIAETAVHLYRRMGIDHPELMIGQSLGHAEAAANEGVRLLLVGLDSDALWFFDVAKQLAASAYETGETYIYHDVDGRNSFAKFMAMRIVATAQWLEGDAAYGASRNTALQHLVDVYAFVRETDSEGAMDPKLTGRLALHLADSMRWREISPLPVVAGARTIWTTLLTALRTSVTDVTNGETGLARAAFDEWFLTYVSNSELRRPISAELTFMEAAVAARVRASLGRGAEPISIVKSIRWPELS